eukprot:7828661-Alexandrium_andersonii.AAC.1
MAGGALHLPRDRLRPHQAARPEARLVDHEGGGPGRGHPGFPVLSAAPPPHAGCPFGPSARRLGGGAGPAQGLAHRPVAKRLSALG